ncbi:MAG: class I tRNA ligase family protein [Candidatus Liptonbacteria bacterium]|nr:class I tRNA ligase family protein [Candidatus Liptonbacteria bacterium]
MEKDRKTDNSGASLNLPKEEERILKFWEEKRIFKKSLEKTRDGEPFTFYDGPPFATGLPHYGHILASTIKDVIPRYQTMKGRFVRRRWGWDCHGLPIEEVVERRLGISGKKQIEEIGIGKFNAICREKVLEFADEWGKMVRRIARWVDFEHSYKTMDRDYMESVWRAFKSIYEKDLVYEGRKVLLYCPRCETPVSNFEVAMDNSYKDVTEEAVTVKFKVKATSDKRQATWINDNTYLLAWTTTPWTLPGNVALAVGEKIDYIVYKVFGHSLIEDGVYINSKTDLDSAQDEIKKERSQNSNFKLEIIKDVKGKDLVGLEYEPLFDVPAVKSEKTFKVYPADFVTTEEGTGIVHTAVVYGEDDYVLGMREGLPVVPLLDEKGKFNDKAPEFLRGIYFKQADKMVIADLERQKLLFIKEKIIHSYPHCWRCGNPLFYNAIPAWFINIQKIKKDLLKSNDKEINWFPEHLKHGRYEKSVEQAPDWNISRNRYWGNPIPVWKCLSAEAGESALRHGSGQGCPPIVVGSIKELGLSSNTFYFSRHGEAQNNVLNIISIYPEKEIRDLTEAGIARAKKLGEKLKKAGGVDMIFSSDLLRTKHTAEIAAKILGAPVEFDERLREYNVGIYNGTPATDFDAAFPRKERWNNAPEGGETWSRLQERIVDFIKEKDAEYKNKRILVISHGDALRVVQKYYGSELDYPHFAEPFKIDVGIADLHRPYIDDVILKCPKCGKDARRVKEIFDSWVEAGSMPFAEYHYPFDQKEVFESRFPAQFVAEYIAQTRAWFYVMHVISSAIFGKAPFENVVTTGTILADDGSKMSKSKNNFPDPWEVIEKYGADALRFYLMNSPVMQADNLNFSLKGVETARQKAVLLLWNVCKYFETYGNQKSDVRNQISDKTNILDKWIQARTQELVNSVSESLDKYDTVRATRSITEYVDDLSTWYLRRSRGREDGSFFQTLSESLVTASKVIAPFMPYLAEIVYAGGCRAEKQESVHLTDWPESKKLTGEQKKLLQDMSVVREAASIGLAARKQLNILVRQPLPRLAVEAASADFRLSPELSDVLLSELNVKAVDPSLMGEKNENVRSFAGTGNIRNFYLDTAISGRLKLEGLARGLERMIQGMRKEAGFKPGEMIEVFYDTADKETEAAMEMLNKKKTYVEKIEKQADSDLESHELEGRKIGLGIRRI